MPGGAKRLVIEVTGRARTRRERSHYTVRAAVFTILCCCGISKPARGPKPEDRCPGTMTIGCYTDEICSFDRQRGCLVCQCDEMGRPLSRPRPDDRSLPPE